MPIADRQGLRGAPSAVGQGPVPASCSFDAGTIFPPVWDAIVVPFARCGSPFVPFDLESSEIMYIDEDLPCDGLRHGARMDASYTAEERTADLATIEDWILAGARY